jgi:hypothetical protein
MTQVMAIGAAAAKVDVQIVVLRGTSRTSGGSRKGGLVRQVVEGTTSLVLVLALRRILLMLPLPLPFVLPHPLALLLNIYLLGSLKFPPCLPLFERNLRDRRRCRDDGGGGAWFARKSCRGRSLR